MIIEIKLANYRSIHEEQTLSFVAERGTRHKDNLIQRPGYRLMKAAALFGANASGKSNFVRAIGEMRDFVRDSATKMNDGDPIECAQPFRLDPESRNAPSRFEITFVTEGVQYVYGFAATRERVHEEWLTATREGREKSIFNIKRNTMTEFTGSMFEMRGLHPSITDLLDDRTRDNALFLSVAARENVTELLPAYRYLKESIWSFNMAEATDSLLRTAARVCKDNKQLLYQVKLLINDADIGINSMHIESVSAAEVIPIRSDFSPQLQDFIRSVHALGETAAVPRVTTFHQDTKGNAINFNLEHDESTGTQRFFAITVPMLDALRVGVFLVIDELDASMHPLLTRRLLEMFQSPEANPNGAQLLFTTHDAVLLDSELFRRDQIILAEKCDNESRFYSLADVVPPPRNTESFLRNYLVGRYGATPHLGPAFETLTVGSKA